MASYVARNGVEFTEIVRAKGDPRFSFLEPNDVHHAYYKSRLTKLQIGDEKEKAKKAAGEFVIQCILWKNNLFL